MKGIFIAAAVVGMWTSALAQTLVAAKDYHGGCAAVGQAKNWSDIPHEHEAAARACLGAVSVLLHAGEERGICTPARVARDDAAAVVARYLDAHVEAGEEEFRSVARVALTGAFPCNAER